MDIVGYDEDNIQGHSDLQSLTFFLNPGNSET